MASDQSELLGGDSICEAWPVDDNEINEDQSDSSTSPCFLFFLHAVLSRPVLDHQEEDEDQLFESPPEYMVDSVDVRRELRMEYDVVMDEESSKPAITKMLSDSGLVPVQAFMVQRILDAALSMSTLKRFAGRKVFRVGVHIEALVDELQIADDDEDEDMAELDGADWEPKFKPASKVSIEELERVKIEEEGGCCSVCFDDFESVCEATRMPCSHLFHGDCIVKWLQNSNFCPLCRFQLPS